MLIYEGNPSRNEVHMKITKKYLKKIDQKLSLIPLSYDRAFKSVFKINLDILKEFLKVTIPININDDDSINLLDSEIPTSSKDEYQRTVDILVVINNNIYIDIEMNMTKFEYVSEHNFSYGDIILVRVIEKGENINNLKYKYIYQLNLNKSPYEDILEDDIVLYGLKTHKIYNSNKHTLTKSLELYKNLYYNENNQEPEVIWYTLLIAETFSELYKLAKKEHEIAKNMLKEKIDEKVISRVTGLTEEDIKKLIKDDTKK